MYILNIVFNTIYFRYNKGTKMILRAIRFIKAGEYIYDNYGPVYTTETKDKRSSTLIERYWFQCRCIACLENWPLFNNMSDTELRLLCRKCRAINVVDRNTGNPIFKCWNCNIVINLMPILMKLMVILSNSQIYLLIENNNYFRAWIV